MQKVSAVVCFAFEQENTKSISERVRKRVGCKKSQKQMADKNGMALDQISITKSMAKFLKAGMFHRT